MNNKKFLSQSLASYMQQWRAEEKTKVAQILLEYDGTSEDELQYIIGEAKYKIEEKYIYDLLDLIQSKNPNCLRKDAQRIARLLCDDLQVSKWEFLKDCITGDIDRHDK